MQFRGLGVEVLLMPGVCYACCYWLWINSCQCLVYATASAISSSMLHRSSGSELQAAASACEAQLTCRWSRFIQHIAMLAIA
jgi:hypothetical protein